MGRDENGGEQVNLVPRERPGDVYTGIANILQKIVDDDIQNHEVGATITWLIPTSSLLDINELTV